MSVYGELTGFLFSSILSRDLPWHLNIAAFINSSTWSEQFTSGHTTQRIFLSTGDTGTFSFRAFVRYFGNLISRKSLFLDQCITTTWLIDLPICHSFPISSSFGRSRRTYHQQLCTERGYSLEDQPETMEDRDGWRESKRIRAICAI